jgi:hypothetical protein
MDDEILKLFREYVDKVGVEKAKQTLESLLPRNSDERTLTIIANAGVHEIPKQYLVGEVYAASHGNIDFSSPQSLHDAYTTILENLLKKLQERSWNKVFLIPTGHATLALQIKIFVYHILRLDTVDLFYHKGNYHELVIDYRKIALKS